MARREVVLALTPGGAFAAAWADEPGLVVAGMGAGLSSALLAALLDRDSPGLGTALAALLVARQGETNARAVLLDIAEHGGFAALAASGYAGLGSP